MASLPDPSAPPVTADPAALAAEDNRTRTQSAIVLLLMLGLFLALPFVLSIGAVVFLPPVTALIFSIVLSPLADRLVRIGVPNMLASALSLLLMLAIVVVVLAVILAPAFDMVDQVPAMAREVARRFAEVRNQMDWLTDFNRQLGRLVGHPTREVSLASPSVIEQLAFATPSVVLETLLTILMTFFMIEARVRMRRRLLVQHASSTASVRIARVLRDVQDRVASYILTVAQINLAVGAIVAGGAYGWGMAAPVMWGGLAFVLNFLPYLGPLVMVSLLALVGLGSASTVPLGLVPPLAFLALHALEANIVTPAILGARFTLNPVSILIAFGYFTWIWGPLGAILSVPILLTISAFIDHLGRPNIVGFLFGEPLFEPGRLAHVSISDTPTDEAETGLML
ncbi:AI-2E family transporter [Novosphingobium sp.]|uniref:AI-2E family transporter n=1 Tax=Novosphingobium sp. TaxID=1874826 RepID=UPI0038BDE69D